jgi:aspartyl-tRNA(Asn)/glutamyl-tRNA(Gln) amidotransferase subunit C
VQLHAIGAQFDRLHVVSGALVASWTQATFHPESVSSMSLTLSDIGRIANLARLELTDAQSETMRVQLNCFFDIVEQMNAVNTQGVEPLAHPTAVIDHVSLRLRPDVASEPNDREANQKSAPAVERGLFLVPKVIE